jgi:hypothetical protein
MEYERIYRLLMVFADLRVGGYLLCRLLAPAIGLFIVWVSRLNSSILLKLFALLITVMLYFLPSIIDIFAS